MKNTTLTLLAVAAIGAVSTGSASAVPFNNVAAAQSETDVQNVHILLRFTYNPPGTAPGGLSRVASWWRLAGDR